MAQINFNNVEKYYGLFKVIHNIEAIIASGQFAVILGPSGCGKSTLLRMIAGLEDISSGTISINDKVMNKIAPKDRGCAMVFQNYALYPHMNVRKNIGYGLKLAKLSAKEQEQRILQAAKMLGLEAYLDRKPHQLSGGQRQRVAIGRAIAREPAVFLFDEPLSNLDAKLRMDTRVELRKLHDRLGATSVFVTHDQIEAMTLADVLIVMNAGRIEQIGSPQDIYQRPKTTFVAGFIGSPPVNLLRIQRAEHGQWCFDDIAPFSLSISINSTINNLVLGIRPEDIEVTTQEGFHLIVDYMEDLGSTRILYGIIGQEKLVLTVPPNMEVARGDRLKLKFPENKIHLFDANSGVRIN